MNNKTPIRFFIMTFAWSWLLWMPLVLGGIGVITVNEDLLISLYLPITIVAAFGPGIAAILSMRMLEGKDSIKPFLKRFLHLRFGKKVWIIVPLIFLVTTFVAWYVPELFGVARLPMLLDSLFLFPFYLLIMIFIGGGQEEIGWRGYISPKLENQFGVWKGSIIMGLVWALWHLPLWFMLGTNQAHMNFFGFIVLTTGYSFILSWVLKASGGRPLSALVAHGFANAFLPFFPTFISTIGVAQPRYWIWVSLTLITGLVIVAISQRKLRPVNS